MDPKTAVAPPAIALIVVSILGLVVSLGVAAVYGAVLSGLFPMPSNQNPSEIKLGATVMVLLGIVSAVISLVVLFGAVRMFRLRNYGFSVAAAIISMVPCCWNCALLGLPFGIWALVMLLRPEVKAAFNGHAASEASYGAPPGNGSQDWRV